MGATIGKGSEEEIKAFEMYGEHLGYAFQIRDDILNIISSKEIAGKSVHSDLLSKRCTFPLVHALDAASTDEKKLCLQALSNGDLSVALELIKDTNAISEAISLTRSHVIQAKHAIQGFNFSQQDTLEKIAEFILQRLH
jgi:geranylgeranyl pyrophosphate synthase